MNKNTPVIMGLLLIIGIAALGYFADLDNNDNNSANDTANYSLLKYQNLTNKTTPDNTVQPSKSSDKSSENTTEQNNTNVTSPNNRTASYTE